MPFMKFRIIAPILFILICAGAQAGNLLQKFDRTAFYAALKGTKTDALDSELSKLKSSAGNEKDAFEGTLLMRKAGLVKIPAEKLKLFKEGRIKLETAIAKDSTVTEYRFLRLIIQEHAPKIVKYSKELQSDKLYIQKHFRLLPSATQNAIVDYCQTSKVLNLPKIFDSL